MNTESLDETDKEILHRLQKDARNYTATEIANEMDVTANTVRNRIHRLQDEGIIETYVPVLDYEQAGFPLETVIICTAPVPKRPDFAEKAARVDGVTFVRELMTGKSNVIVTAVAAEGEEITRVASELHEIGFTIEEEKLVKNSYAPPVSYFRPE